MNEYLKQAKKFLKETDTKLEVKFKEFGSMSWDKNGQKRNIFSCTLTNKNGSYTFDFGDSLKNSVQELSEWDMLRDDDDIEVYAGCSLQKYKIYGSTTFNIKRSQIGYEEANFILDQATVIMHKLNEGIAKHNAEQMKLPYFKRITIQNSYKDPSHFVPTVQKSILNRIQSLKNKQAMSNVPLEEMNFPNAYDILSCLSVSWFRDADEVADEFGCMKPSQAQAIYEQDQELQRLFDEEQIEMLNEIS